MKQYTVQAKHILSLEVSDSETATNTHNLYLINLYACFKC